jgi:hypothetical protein
MNRLLLPIRAADEGQITPRCHGTTTYRETFPAPDVWHPSMSLRWRASEEAIDVSDAAQRCASPTCTHACSRFLAW